MTSKKAILLKAAVASLGLAFIGVGFNAVNTTAAKAHDTIVAVETVEIHTSARPAPPEDVRVMEPGSEPPAGDITYDTYEEPPHEMAGEVGEMYTPPDFEAERREHEKLRRRLEIVNMPRAEALRLAEDLHRVLREHDLPPEEREQAEFELGTLMDYHFTPAAGDSTTANEIAVEPKNGDSHTTSIFSQLDVNNIFNKMWGLLQGVILAWIPYALNKKKKEDLLTNSMMDKIDEELVARHRAKYSTEKHKVDNG